MTKQQLKQDITVYVANNGGNYRNWYAGITSDVDKRLFGDHGVNQANGVWIHGPADSSDDARFIEVDLHNLGCDGDTGGGDNTSRIVYCYQKNLHTYP